MGGLVARVRHAVQQEMLRNAGFVVEMEDAVDEARKSAAVFRALDKRNDLSRARMLVEQADREASVRAADTDRLAIAPLLERIGALFERFEALFERVELMSQGLDVKRQRHDAVGVAAPGGDDSLSGGLSEVGHQSSPSSVCGASSVGDGAVGGVGSSDPADVPGGEPSAALDQSAALGADLAASADELGAANAALAEELASVQQDLANARAILAFTHSTLANLAAGTRP